MTENQARFEEHFWGEGIRGYDILMHNFRAGTNSSKEMVELLKEISAAEETYAKMLQKVGKTYSHVADSAVGTFFPVWSVILGSLSDLSHVHEQFSETLIALQKEVSEYHHAQKDRHKANTKGEIDDARECYAHYMALEQARNKTKKVYEHQAQELAALKVEIETAPPKLKEKLEDKMKKVEGKLKDACSEHKDVVSQHCKIVMDLQGKFKEALQKFQYLEEEHLQQMYLFTIKYTSSIDYKHRQLQEVHSRVCGRLNSLPGDFLITQFSLKKGTGSEKPRPELFKEIIVNDLIRALKQDGVDGPGGGDISKKSTIKFFNRTTKQRHRGDPINAAVSPTPPDSKPSEVDEEGYSIRPADADKITGFEESKGNSSDSDSDEDMPKNQINVTIKEKSLLQTATADELKSIKLTGPSPGVKIAGMSPLNKVLPNFPSKASSISEESSKAKPIPSSTSSDLFDINFDVSSNISTPSANGSQPSTAAIPQELPSPIKPITTKPNSTAGSAKGFNNLSKDSTGDKVDGPDPVKLFKPIPAPRRSSATLPNRSMASATNDFESSLDHTSRMERNVSDSPQPLKSTGFETDFSLDLQQKSSGNPGGTGLLRPPPQTGRRSRQRSGNSPNTSGTSSPLISQKTLLGQPHSTSLTPSLLASALNDSDLMNRKRQGPQSGIESPNFPRDTSYNSIGSTSSLSAISDQGVVSGSSTPPNSNLSVQQANKSASQADPSSVVPIAVAFFETANVIFKPKILSESPVKVTGELAMSFPASCIGQLLIHDELKFTLSGTERLCNILHNTQFVIREPEVDEALFKFDMEKLFLNLSQKAGESPSAPFYNLLVLRYEVPCPAKDLPLQLSSIYKIEEPKFKATVKYSLNGATPLQGVNIFLPVEGDVGNAEASSSGVWSGDKKRVTWRVPLIKPGDSGLFEASLDHLGTGSLLFQNSQVQFVCDGSNLTNLQVNLKTPAYRISLKKERLSSGRYEAETLQK